MAGGGVHGPPYRTALHLTAWAVTNSSYCNAKLTTLGVDREALTLDSLCDLIHMLMVETAHLPHNRVAELVDQPFWIERDTWGQGPVSEAAHRAMMALTGGPAPLRDPSAQRPRPVGTVVPETPQESPA